MGKARANEPERVFLDTSVLYVASFGTSRQKQFIRDRLRGRDVASCLYVLTEIKNQVCTLIDLYFQMRRSANYIDAWRLAANDVRARRVKIALLALTHAMETKSREQALSKLSNVIY